MGSFVKANHACNQNQLKK